MIQRIFPIIITLLQGLSGAVYISQGDWKRALIWFSFMFANIGIIIV